MPPGKAESLRAAAKAADVALTRDRHDCGGRGRPLPVGRPAAQLSSAPPSATSERRHPRYNAKRTPGSETATHARHDGQKELAHLPAGIGPDFERHYKLFPSSAYLRARAPKNVPLFSFEYGDTGAGADVGIARQLGGLRRHQDRAALRRHHHRAAGRGRIVRHRATPRRSASRRWAGRRWSGRAPICSWPRPRSARAFPTRSASPAAPPSRRSPRSRPTCSGCSSIASTRTTTPSAST